MKRLQFSLFTTIVAACFMFGGCTEDSGVDTPQQQEDEESPESETLPDEGEASLGVNGWTDDNMLTDYLYNEEYATMSRDMSLDYDEFLNTTLWNMTTNVLDKKIYSSSSYDIFTYIYRSLNTKATSYSDKYSVSYGAIYPYFTYAKTTSGESLVVLSFESLYPSSPLSDAGISRSDVFYAADGELFTTSNVSTIYNALLYPSAGDTIELLDITGKSYTITARETYLTPILDSQIIEKSGGIKVGYMNMSCYDFLFEDELLEVLQRFNEAGVNEFILDLRRNYGGYIYTANQLCSCIASITEPTPLIYRRFNDNLTELYSSFSSSYTWLTYDAESGLFSELAYTDSKLTASHLTSLNSKKIYCLTTFNTASASELTINLLRGIGFDVVTIGTTTRGKNVGSNEFTLIDGDYTYLLNIINMQLYNAELFGDYEDGFTPETENILYEDYPFGDYGEGETLFDRAMELITGVGTESKSDSTESVESRSGSSISIVSNRAESIIEPRTDRPHGAIDISRE